MLAEIACVCAAHAAEGVFVLGGRCCAPGYFCHLFASTKQAAPAPPHRDNSMAAGSTHSGPCVGPPEAAVQHSCTHLSAGTLERSPIPAKFSSRIVFSRVPATAFTCREELDEEGEELGEEEDARRSGDGPARSGDGDGSAVRAFARIFYFSCCQLPILLCPVCMQHD